MSEHQQSAVQRLYHETVMDLPATTRAIFLEHRVDGDALATIAARHALPADAVARHIADALVAIDKAIRRAGF